MPNLSIVVFPCVRPRPRLPAPGDGAGVNRSSIAPPPMVIGAELVRHRVADRRAAPAEAIAVADGPEAALKSIRPRELGAFLGQIRQQIQLTVADHFLELGRHARRSG